ncbi:MAG: CDP-alcohol phosphatidyltransferase family protein [Anaerolineae bacterium]|nr:CDP-alcohol phosphatidyltransferase family protein [Anaerolineae bacterium]MBT3714241.1 CDP-alcohol phosphatidyltransferase family protein [Anaerolineae bacterium]MBT4459112.1 CDP-alcohol phosphatidyltransferase family protein [Anaerolineae bacterium]MBT4840925.1 CDP-alcohol phosphatidyltransferase family protein [Anaerolineae bacterium]MBT6060705.1 CDP-alcohol phosphatidyltransferase family protein [Anaerolineae bacterium]
MKNTVKTERVSLTDRLRILFKWVLDPIGAFLNRLGLTPNTITMLGLVGSIVAGFFLAKGNMLWGGLIVLVMWPVDALDGTMARLRGEPTDFGGFVDSVTDRYSELVIYAGLLYYFLEQGDTLASMLVFAAASGSILVSYTRARAEALDFDAKIGALTRVERYLVLAPGLVFNFPLIAMWIIAILANFTALQRIWYVRRQAHKHF